MDMLEQLSELGVLNAIHPAPAVEQTQPPALQPGESGKLTLPPFKLKSPIGSYTLEQGRPNISCG